MNSSLLNYIEIFITTMLHYLFLSGLLIIINLGCIQLNYIISHSSSNYVFSMIRNEISFICFTTTLFIKAMSSGASLLRTFKSLF